LISCGSVQNKTEENIFIAIWLDIARRVPLRVVRIVFRLFLPMVGFNVYISHKSSWHNTLEPLFFMHHAVRISILIFRLHKTPFILRGCRWSTKSGLTGNTGTRLISGHTKEDLHRPSRTWRNITLIRTVHLLLWPCVILLSPHN
jgi:hypothetical protein